MSHLVACPSCSRHVRASEDACPFCKAALSQALRETPAPMRPALGLSRSALYAVGASASALALIAACSSDPEPELISAYGSPPWGCTFDGDEVFGASCTGSIYVPSEISECCPRAYLACLDGTWTYTTTLPAGYMPVPDAGAATVDAGTEAGDAESDGAADATNDTGAHDASDASDAGDAG